MLAANDYKGFYCFEWEKKWHPEIEEPEVAFPQLRQGRGRVPGRGRGEAVVAEAAENGRPGCAKNDALSRREFLERSGLAVGAVAAMPALPPRRRRDAARVMPQRVLGRTGVERLDPGHGLRKPLPHVPGGPGLGRAGEGDRSGINYLDTAVGYGDGESETRVGRVMATRRKDVFLATKVPTRSRTRDAALKEVEASLKRLQTDHLDLLHLHSLGDEADLAKIEAPDGAMKALYELREQKVTRFIGMTSHTDGAVMAKAIERNDLDCVQMAMNPARAARFEELALPAANRKNLGVILMKVTGQDKLMEDGRRPTPRLSCATPGACRSRPPCAACRSSSSSRRTWRRRGPTRHPCRRRDGEAAAAAGRPQGRARAVLRPPPRRRLDGVGRQRPSSAPRPRVGGPVAAALCAAAGFRGPGAASRPPPRPRNARASASAATAISHGSSQTPFTAPRHHAERRRSRRRRRRARAPAAPSTTTAATAGAGAGRAGATAPAPGAAREGRPPASPGRGAATRATPPGPTRARARAAGSPRRDRAATATPTTRPKAANQCGSSAGPRGTRSSARTTPRTPRPMRSRAAASSLSAVSDALW